MKWPTICIDNFLEHPHEVVRVANSFSYAKSSGGSWPGERNQPPLDKELDQFLLAKILKVVLPTYNKTFKAKGRFQRIVKNGEGWIHSDKPHEFTAIIYLSNTKKCGTSLYKSKSFKSSNKNQQYKIEYNKTGIKPEGYEQALRENNDQYEETIYFESVYNRLIIFDSCQLHGVRDYNGSEDRPRLTYVSFFNDIQNS